MLKKYYCIRQHDISDCGAACIATISKQYGLKIPITKIREYAGTDREGTNAIGIIKAAEQLGFSAKGVSGERKDLFSGFPLPAIAHVVMDGTLLHYVVIHSIKENEILVADPGQGMIKYTMDDFDQIWTGVLLFITPNHNFKQGDETVGLFKRFMGLLKPQKRLVTHIFFSSLLYTILGILGAFYYKFLMDDILPDKLDSTLLVVSIASIILTIFKVIINAYRTHLLLFLSQKIDIPLMLGYYNHVIDLPLDFFGSRKVGEIITRFTDASKIRTAISGATLTIMIDTVMAIVGGILLYSYNAFLFSIAVIILVCYSLIVFLFNKPLRVMNKEQMTDNSKLTSFLVESLNGIESIKAYNAERAVKLKTEAFFVKSLKSIFRLGMINNVRGSLSIFIGAVGGNLILWAGAYNIINGELTIGQLLVFNSLLAYFIEPVKNLINLQPMLQTAIVASDRLGEILDLNKEKEEHEHEKLKPKKLYGKIELRNVSFRYGTRKLILDDINMQINPGDKIAIVGESGSGKTTLVKLLMSFYQPEEGEIILDGSNIRDIELDALRSRISYVPQNTFLFSGSIRENLELGNDSVTFDEVIEASQKAQAHEFISEMQLRYSARLDENGANLSGGQRQRLAITRAILNKPDLLILDEATSSLDSITEKAIEETIREVSSDITSIVIAHRLSTIMKCDRIYVLDKGKIIEMGSHQQLIRNKGKYHSMWKDQLPEVNS